MPTPPPPPNPTAAHPARRFEDRVWVLHVFTLSSLVFAQPLFDLLATHAEFFVVRRSSGGEILGLAAVLLLLPPLPPVALVALARRLAPRLGTFVLGAVLAVLAALLALLILTRGALLDGAAWLAAGLLAGAAFAWAYQRLAALRLLLTYLALALVVVPASFLLHPRILKLVASPETAAPAASETAAEIPQTGARTPIVFLLFDEFSLTALLDASRRIDATNYPNLAALAGEATWFANATTVSDVTEIAVPAILTGNLPAGDRLPILEDHPRNLFTILGDDYRLWAFEPITRLCPPARNTAAGGAAPLVPGLAALTSDLWVVYQHLLLPPSYAVGLPVISDRWRDFRRAAPPDAAATSRDEPAARPAKDEFFKAAIRAMRRDRQQDLRRLLAAFDPQQPRSLYFAHLLLPHTPWEYLPSGKAYLAAGVPGLRKERWDDDPGLVVQAYQRYLLQVGFVDLWIGRIVERLRQLDLYDRSLIVLAADHGVSFRPDDSRRVVTETNAHDLIPVPLLIKAPHQRDGRVVERQVSTLDILPTILDLLDVDPPPPAPDGRSVFDPAAGPATRRVVGKHRTFDFDDRLHRDKYRTLDWKLETFASRSDGVNPLRAGIHPELFGRQVAEVGWEEQDAVTIEFTGDSLFGRNDAYSPAFVTGTLTTTAADAGCCDLAVAVNGTLYATVRARGTPPDLRWNALVPDQAFRQGDNRVEVFRVRRGGPNPVLELLGTSSGGSYALVKDAEERAVAIDRNGRAVAVEPGAANGYFSATTERGTVTVWGWAVDLEARAEPERILLFHRGELVYGGFTSKPHQGGNAQHGLPPTVRSAFRFQLPERRVPDLAGSGLRLFALTRDAASELGYFHRLGRGKDGRVEKLLVSNGRQIPVIPSALGGGVDKAWREGDRLVLAGWTADVAHREPAAAVLVFDRDKLIYKSQGFVERRDVAAGHDMPEILRSGFRVRLAVERQLRLDSPHGLSAQGLDVLAVSRRGEATLLSLPRRPPGGRGGDPQPDRPQEGIPEPEASR